MQETGNDIQKQPRMTIRVGDHSLEFALADKASKRGLLFESYTVKSSFSIAANLREAFRQSMLLARPCQRAQIMVAAPTMLVPIEEFDEQQAEVAYRYSFICSANIVVVHTVLPLLNAVAVFSMNKDLKAVIDDHYEDVLYMPIEHPVWSYMLRRGHTVFCRRLYAYFHDEQVSIFAFDKNRFRFSNTYDATRLQDSIYYLLSVWKQLQMDAEKDELYLAGQVIDGQALAEGLKRYLRRVYTISPAAEFNRAAITEVKGMPLDMQILYLNGR